MNFRRNWGCRPSYKGKWTQLASYLTEGKRIPPLTWWINIHRTVSISALACYVSIDKLLLNLSYASASVSKSQIPYQGLCPWWLPSPRPTPTRLLGDAGWLEIPLLQGAKEFEKTHGKVFQMPCTISRDTKKHTPNYKAPIPIEFEPWPLTFHSQSKTIKNENITSFSVEGNKTNTKIEENRLHNKNYRPSTSKNSVAYRMLISVEIIQCRNRKWRGNS